MKRSIILFLLTGCAYPVAPSSDPIPETVVDAGMVLDAGADAAYQKPEVKHVPDAMPPLCHVGVCRAWSDDRIIGVCDPCEDAGELCRIDGEYGTCKVH